MILRQAFAEGRGFFDQIGVVAHLRPQERGFEKTAIADAGRTAIALDLIRMNRERFIDGDVIRHSASFLYSDPKVSWLAR